MKTFYAHIGCLDQDDNYCIKVKANSRDSASEQARREIPSYHWVNRVDPARPELTAKKIRAILRDAKKEGISSSAHRNDVSAYYVKKILLEHGVLAAHV